MALLFKSWDGTVEILLRFSFVRNIGCGFESGAKEKGRPKAAPNPCCKGYFTNLQRITPANPKSEVPNRMRLEGSGTVPPAVVPVSVSARSLSWKVAEEKSVPSWNEFPSTPVPSLQPNNGLK